MKAKERINKIKLKEKKSCKRIELIRVAAGKGSKVEKENFESEMVVVKGKGKKALIQKVELKRQN